MLCIRTLTIQCRRCTAQATTKALLDLHHSSQTVANLDLRRRSNPDPAGAQVRSASSVAVQGGRHVLQVFGQMPYIAKYFHVVVVHFEGNTMVAHSVKEEELLWDVWCVVGHKCAVSRHEA